ncbi:MAG: diguanylate cyclase domain-containing protein [Nocardioidaceae bacterium]
MDPSGVEPGRMSSLAAAARALGRSGHLLAMVEIAAEEAARALDAASVSISRLEQGTGTIRTLINVGDLGPHEERWPANEIYRLDDFAQLRSVVADMKIWTTASDDPGADPEEVRLLKELDKDSSMGAPLVVDGKLWGELYATRRRGTATFSDSDAAYISVLAAILAGAVSRALHVESLERRAFFDPLTGLANRWAFDEAIERAFDVVAGRVAPRVTVIMVDVNGLKAVNDAHGHGEGDLLLKAVAGLLSDSFASLHGSLVARLGGDEFVVLVAGYDIEHVMGAAAATCATAFGLPLCTGLSCGVATTVNPGPGSARRLFDAADQAQYRAKRDHLELPVLAASTPSVA